MKRYICLQENNEWEGETWFFYCPYKITKEHTKEKWDDLLYNLSAQIFDVNHSWRLYKSNCDPKIVETIVEYAPDLGNYMSTFNYGDELNYKEVKNFIDCEECKKGINQWYKGNFWISCKCKRRYIHVIAKDEDEHFNYFCPYNLTETNTREKWSRLFNDLIKQLRDLEIVSWNKSLKRVNKIMNSNPDCDIGSLVPIDELKKYVQEGNQIKEWPWY